MGIAVTKKPRKVAKHVIARLKGRSLVHRLGRLGFQITESQQGTVQQPEGDVPIDAWKDSMAQNIVAARTDAGVLDPEQLRTEYAALGGRYGPLRDPYIHSERAYVVGTIPARLFPLFEHFLNRTDKVIAGRPIPVTYAPNSAHEDVDEHWTGLVPVAKWVGEGADRPAPGDEGPVTVTCVDPTHGRALDHPNGILATLARVMESVHRQMTDAAAA